MPGKLPFPNARTEHVRPCAVSVGETRTPQVPFLDVNDPAFSFNSSDVAMAQARNWYAQSPVGILVLRHADCQELLRDRRLKTDAKGYLEMCGIVDGPVYDWLVPNIGNRDGDDHHRLRGLVNKTFTPRMIEGLRPFIRVQAERLAEELASVEVCDFVEDFANPLHLAVMSELLGVPAEDYDTFRTWSTDIGLVFSLTQEGDIAARVETAVVGLYGYVDSLMRDKQARPIDDLISALVVAQQSDGSVSREELLNLIVTLVFAAHDTTRHQLANAMVTFAEHPEQWTVLAQRPELTAQAVEEVMRWCPSNTALYRFAAEGFDYRDLHVAKGTPLLLGVDEAGRGDVCPGGHGSHLVELVRAQGPVHGEELVVLVLTHPVPPQWTVVATGGWRARRGDA
jgi:cytochrome P450